MTALTEAYLGLGSNSPDAGEVLAKAADAISRLPGVRILARSPVYLTEPQDMADQPWFHNQTLKLGLESLWRAEALLAALLQVETNLGRVRSPELPRFGPRRIDIDLLLFGEESLNNPACTLPHPRMLDRAFVLLPLLDLEPELSVAGRPLRHWLDGLDWRREGRKIFQRQDQQ